MATAEQDQPPVAQLAALLPQIVAKTGHSDMWGVELSSGGDDGVTKAPVQVVLHKFLRANNDVGAAEKQLVAALEWRKAVDPVSLVAQPYDARRFGGLGFVTTHHDEAAANDNDVVVTWNVYGSVKDNKATFGNVQDFIKWRAALMELGVQKLRLNEIKESIAAGADDPYRMIQVHDYQSVSFFRMDPDVKAASRETIRTLSMAYPELLAHKYFVNVPAIMGWVFGAMKLFLAPATLRKFHPMASGTSLAAELKGISATLPIEYGGKGPSVKEGLTVRLTTEDQVEGAAAHADPGKTSDLQGQEKPAGGEVPAPAAPQVVAKTETDPKPAVETKPGVATAGAPVKEPTQ